MEKRQHPLIIDKEYHIWLEGRYLGKAFYQADENIGDSFIIPIVDSDGQYKKLVAWPDEWELVE